MAWRWNAANENLQLASRQAACCCLHGRRSHPAKQMREHAAYHQRLRAAAQRKQHAPRFLAPRGEDVARLHDKPAMHLPEALRIQPRQQIAEREADQVLPLPVTTRTYLSAAAK